MRTKITGSLLLILSVLYACKPSGMEQYEALLAKEQKSCRRTDSLFMGIKLGMEQKVFYGHCWELNNKGVLTDGNSNTTILHKLHQGQLKHPASMTFYPEFINGKVAKMMVNFRYDGWAPWNTHLQSGQLLEDVLQLFQKWYPSGNPFIRLEDERRGSIYVKVDGNRRITIGCYDDMNVKADYTDLSAIAK